MKRRDRIVVAIANLVLRAASKRYRDLTKALIVRGMEAELCVCWQRQAMFEELPEMPTLRELEALAVLYETSPGHLLDECYERVGRKLREEEEGDAEEAAESNA